MLNEILLYYAAILLYFMLYIQGRLQYLAGGLSNIFFRFGNLHVAKRHAAHGEAMRFDGGVRGHAPPRKFFQMVQFGAFWCIFGSDFVFKKFQKLLLFI